MCFCTGTFFDICDLAVPALVTAGLSAWASLSDGRRLARVKWRIVQARRGRDRVAEIARKNMRGMLAAWKDRDAERAHRDELGIECSRLNKLADDLKARLAEAEKVRDAAADRAAFIDAALDAIAKDRDLYRDALYRMADMIFEAHKGAGPALAKIAGATISGGCSITAEQSQIMELIRSRFNN